MNKVSIVDFDTKHSSGSKLWHDLATQSINVLDEECPRRAFAHRLVALPAVKDTMSSFFKKSCLGGSRHYMRYTVQYVKRHVEVVVIANRRKRGGNSNVSGLEYRALRNVRGSTATRMCANTETACRSGSVSCSSRSGTAPRRLGPPAVCCTVRIRSRFSFYLRVA